MTNRIKAGVGVIPCNLDEAQRSQLMASRVVFDSKQGLTPSYRVGPWICSMGLKRDDIQVSLKIHDHGSI